jgi:hypothetical protein
LQINGSGAAQPKKFAVDRMLMTRVVLCSERDRSEKSAKLSLFS